MKTYAVTLPIAGHAFLEVEADSEERAIAKALKLASIEHLESFDELPEARVKLLLKKKDEIKAALGGAQ